MVLFSAGGWRVAVEACWVTASRLAPAHSCGCEIEALLGFDSAASDAPRQYLQLSWPGGSQEVLVGSPVELVSLCASTIYPLPALLAKRTRLRGLRAIALLNATGLASTQEMPLVLLFDANCLAPSP
ncbi:MAG: Uncharacterized protein FD135_512 [Comamonadaceae bacterium]|nr:MAG: Uncharacterized protein FD135_512 [Comamonadaceae bacterium]